MMKELQNNLEKQEKKKSRNYSIIAIFLVSFIALLSLLINFRNFGNILSSAGILLPIDDSAYHLRRIFAIFTDFPSMPMTDYYLNYPEGVTIGLAPGFDLLVSFAGKILLPAGAREARQIMEFIAFLIIPILGTLTIIPLYFLVKPSFGRTAAILAILFYVLIPSNLISSGAGTLNHHVIEPLFAMLILMLVLKGEQDPDRGPAVYCIFGGLTIGASYFFWTGAPFFLLFLICVMLVTILLKPYACLPLIETYGLSVFLSIPLGLLFVLNSPFSDQWTFYGFSISHIILLSLLTLLSVVLYFVSFGKSLNIRAQVVFAIIFSAALLTGLAIVLFPKFSLFLMDGLKYLTGSGYDGSKHGISFREIFSQFGWTIFLTPVTIFFLFGKGLRDEREEEISFQYFLSIYMILIVILFFNRSWNQIFAPIHAAGLAFILTELYRILNEKISLFQRKPFFNILTVGLFSCTFCIPGIITVMSPARHKHAETGIISALTWLKDHTRKVGDPFRMQNKPEYGVLSHPSFSHLVAYVGERASLGSFPPGSTSGGQGGKLSFDFLCGKDLKNASDLLRQNNIKYVILTAADMEESPCLEPGDKKQENPAAEGTIYDLLYNRDASGFEKNGIFISPASNFRLIHEERMSEHSDGLIKIFEFQDGMKIYSDRQAGRTISISAEIATNTGRKFIFADRRELKDFMNFDFTLPYSTDGNPFDVTVNGTYILDDGLNKCSIRIDELELSMHREKYLDKKCK